MDGNVEHEICNNCKKEIPQTNYVMHTMHCARNITLCKTCNEPVPKAQYDDHKKTCETKPVVTKKKPSVPSTNLENSSYFQTRKAVEDKKAEARKDRYLEKHSRLVDTGYSLNSSSSNSTRTGQNSVEKTNFGSNFNGRPLDTSGSYASRQNGISEAPTSSSLPMVEKSAPVSTGAKKKTETKSSGMLACKFCDLELPKLELDDHENYCGSRTDQCLECGELVMFKYKQIHMDSNHGFLKLKDEPGPRPSWDSSTQRSTTSETSSTRRRPPPMRFTDFDYDPMPYLPSSYSVPGGSAIKKKEGESYKEISRRLDCKTEYIRNLLHDSAGITIPLRRSGTVPRNHFNHNKGPAPQPPAYRRRNPPTELTIPCEFCSVPVPHEDLIQHETGCRPDLARFNPRRRSPEPDDYFIAPQPSSPEVELPCEFCGDMIPASQLLGHQVRCN